MPELPEVETVVRTLAPRMRHRRIVRASFFSRFVVRENFATLSRRLKGRVVERVHRHGKFILFELDKGRFSVHLGMTGKLLFNGAAGPYTRAVFELDQGTLIYDDIRHFGRIAWSPDVPALGPDALDIDEKEFGALLRSRQSRIKPLLLNQKAIRGMGNIYTDEALFRARIHPKAISSHLTRERVRKLHEAMRQVLTESIASKGSSISDYVDAAGNSGSFQFLHRVYGKSGKPCPTCGTAIRRILVAQRGTHYCPKCQREAAPPKGSRPPR